MIIIWKKIKSLNKKKVSLEITEIFIGSGSIKGASTMFLMNPSIRIVSASSTALLTSIAILIKNEYLSNIKTDNTKVPDWINVTILLYEKNIQQSMRGKKIDEKEAEELKKIYNHYLDKKNCYGKYLI